MGDEGAEFVCMDMLSVVGVDASAMDTFCQVDRTCAGSARYETVLPQVASLCKASGTTILLSGVSEDVKRLLHKAGVFDLCKVEEHNCLDAALAAVEDALLLRNLPQTTRCTYTPYVSLH
jgi:anti-anti-sigma regulatory factor